MVPQVVGNVWINSTELPRTSTGHIKVFQHQIPSRQTCFPVSNNLTHDNYVQDSLTSSPNYTMTFLLQFQESLLTVQDHNLVQTPSKSPENLAKSSKILPSSCFSNQNSQSQKKRTLLPLQKHQLIVLQLTHFRTPKIPTMVIIQIAIKINQNSSQMLQNSSRSPRIAQEPPLQPGYYSRNSTAPAKLPIEYYSLHSTRTLCRVTIQKSKGTKHCS